MTVSISPKHDVATDDNDNETCCTATKVSELELDAFSFTLNIQYKRDVTCTVFMFIFYSSISDYFHSQVLHMYIYKNHVTDKYMP